MKGTIERRGEIKRACANPEKGRTKEYMGQSSEGANVRIRGPIQRRCELKNTWANRAKVRTKEYMGQSSEGAN